MRYTYTILILFISLILISCNSPGLRTLYDNQDVTTIPFECEKHIVHISPNIIEISPADIRTCLFSNDDKVIWLLFLYYDCMGGAGEELELQSLYSDKIDLQIISMNYDVENIKKEEETIGKPIYFIKRIENRMRKNRDIFISEIFGVDLGKNFTRPTSIFVHKGEIIKVGYQIDNEFIKQVLFIANMV